MKLLEGLTIGSVAITIGGAVLSGIALATKNNELLNAGLIVSSAGLLGGDGCFGIYAYKWIKEDSIDEELNKGFVEGYYGA